MELAKIEVDTFGGSPVAEHNMPCAVCRERHAILDLNCGVMLPCWTCQREGFRTFKFENGSMLLKFVEWVLQ